MYGNNVPQLWGDIDAPCYKDKVDFVKSEEKEEKENIYQQRQPGGCEGWAADLGSDLFVPYPGNINTWLTHNRQ